MKSKSIVFDVKKCQNYASGADKSSGGAEKACKNDEDILKFTNDLVVQVWIIKSKLDMRFINEKSKSRNQILVSQSNLQ